MNLSVVAGVVSTAIFAASMMPMLFWYLRYTESPIRRWSARLHDSTEATDLAAA